MSETIILNKAIECSSCIDWDVLLTGIIIFLVVYILFGLIELAYTVLHRREND